MQSNYKMYLKQNYKKFYIDKKTTTIMFARESTYIKTTKNSGL